jgi:hypothetical protein
MTQNQNEIIITDEESKICKLDGKIFDSSKKMIWYVRKTYKLSFEEYILKAYYNNVKPTCLKTGKTLSFKPCKLGPWFKNYSQNHFPRNPHTKETKDKIKIGCEKTSLKKFGVKNVFSSNWCKEKIKNTMIKKYGVSNVMYLDDMKAKVLSSFFETIKSRPKKIYITGTYDPNKPSSLELDLKNKLKELNIQFESPFVYQGKRYDFYIPEINSIIELDGDAYHKDALEKLTIITINGSVNDYHKNKLIEDTTYDFYRIRYDTNEFTFMEKDELYNKIQEFTYTPNYSLTYKQKIVNKEYFKRYIESHGKEKLKKYSKYFLKFIRTFQPKFPYPDLEENLQEVIKDIQLKDVSKVYNQEAKEFSNNISTVGHNYLKHHFHSYWNSHFNGNKSPIDAWTDDKIMKEVIDYRIGLNNSNEIFDFSLHQLIRGLSARRITISFFKPLLAASIYKHYIGEKVNPIVFDPCCGFGGRLLGFKSVYPDGKYIGCEPNIETFQELQSLVKDGKWENSVELHNCKLEDFVHKQKYDLIFTSIPYFDLEIYSSNNNISYSSFEEWKSTFIRSIENCKNYGRCLINIPVELSEKLQWNSINSYVLSNTTHFNKNENQKKEVIIEL